MAEIITEPTHSHVVHSYEEDRSAGGGVALLAVALIVVLALVFFYYALPTMSRNAAPQINVPDKVNVNINKTQ